jgi:ABC-type cobalamin transport system ATPase subunit
MIYELHVRSPKLSPVKHWDKVDWLKGKKLIEFKPGINVVYGLNGTGKSTLLSGLAMLEHCWRSNWPRVDKTSIGDFLGSSGRYLDGLLLEHDGSPCRYLGVDDPDHAPKDAVVNNDLALETKREAHGRALHLMSHGQATLNKLIRFLKAEPQKVRHVLKDKNVATEWRGWYTAATESLFNATKRKDMPRQQTILLDEVDRSLDFTKQASVWKQVRLLAESNHQIIIASHSPWAAVQPHAHYIETTPGYLERTRKALGVLLQNLGEEEASRRTA